jgi:hypothetical protein
MNNAKTAAVVNVPVYVGVLSRSRVINGHYMQHVMMVGNHTSTKMANDGVHEKRRQYMQHVDNRTSTKMANNDHDLCVMCWASFDQL